MKRRVRTVHARPARSEPARAGPSRPPAASGLPEWIRRLGPPRWYGTPAFGRRERQVVALGLTGLGLFSGLVLLGLSPGRWSDAWAGLLRSLFGWGSLLIAAGWAGLGMWMLLRTMGRAPALNGWRLLAFEGALLGLFGLAHGLAMLTAEAPWEIIERGEGGGTLGWLIWTAVSAPLGPGVGVVLLMLITGIGGWFALARWAPPSSASKVTAPAPALAPPARPPQPPKPARPSPRPAPGDLKIVTASPPRSVRVKRDRRLPPLDLLEEEEPPAVSPEEIRQKAAIIEETLRQFGLEARVVEATQGPAVTQFGLLPGYIERPGPEGEVRRQKVRVAQIAALANDLALALAAPSLRIEAPVPGRGLIGIEVPNQRIHMVRLRGLLASPEFRKIGSPLAIALGRDVAGRPVVADLAAMPHLLIAGTTGSGKSVCIHALITCLVYNNTPEELRLVLIDPKMVELVRWNGLPHLYGKVEFEIERVVGVLRWLTRQMEERYRQFAAVGARNLADFNARAEEAGETRLPYIVLFIDELADLMMAAPVDVERTITRLAQMARATGIHLVIATQRPSVDVVTGLIKANFPARIAFAVASSVDSRVILDMPGAETLLGRGDMLFLPPDLGKPVRVQGAYVSDEEVERVVRFWQERYADERPEPAPWEGMVTPLEVGSGRSVSRGEFEEEDEETLLREAIEIIKRHRGASTSLLQRKLRIGYPKAARLIDRLEELGIIGPPEPSGRLRPLLIPDNWEPPPDWFRR
ncbi:DNA translocase SpoIIIE [Candidatus Thermoflexus japonica]|uniref:DNA translocase SpoIIIE n=1 Tax=Candidatus Thermoflexus japonica TaxID=2035417 RepID=A0A2H5Y6P2_9CHLR|nr:DNA translocase SpoIIIE [Candidatus Thermoflexus japonica]